eukprot:Seg855.2 transcript_id=Seg855.2/GoldUCD/mRNA.D3Y31 product="hypothetical protein" protein_id=Seg855.2/GoldUCD/D3Y31
MDTLQVGSEIDSQLSIESTITLSHPSQKLWTDSDEVVMNLDVEKFVDKECQTVEGKFLPKDEYDKLVKKGLEQIDSQYSTEESTISLSQPSQNLWTDSDEMIIVNTKTPVEKESQTMEGTFLLKDDFEKLLEKAQQFCNFKEELNKIRLALPVGSEGPEMDPDAFESFCEQAGAKKLFSSIYNAMISEKMSKNRKDLSKVRTMVIIYMMVYRQSQKANSFQVTLSRTLQQFGISEQGLISLRNLGIAAHPHTVKSAAKSSASSHLDNLSTFFENAAKNNHFLAIFIDDYHNIHTKHRPESKTQTKATHMTTLLVKIFPNIEAIEKDGNLPCLSEEPVEITVIKNILAEGIPILSKSYAQVMPDWMVSKYFDPEAQRNRLVVHDYQQTEVRTMRCMDHCKLVDCIESPLKSLSDILSALEHMLVNGLSIYLDKFLVPFVGDWPTQYYMRQLAYSDDANIPALCKSIAPLIGPLHISINSRECVLMIFHHIFADLYSFLFGSKAKLAKKPKPWRISLLLEVIYGGGLSFVIWFSLFSSQCKDIQYLTLLNLLDNYVPLVLSIYSIVFKCNNYEQYCQSLLRCWVMFMVFQRRHYDKALLVALSMFRYWRDRNHPFFEKMLSSLVAFDEYPVENFHSVLRARTKEGNTGDQINFKAKEIYACKHELHSFKSRFVPPKKYNFSNKRVDQLKIKAAQYLTGKCQEINENLGAATVLERAPRQRKDVVKWKLPNLFGDETVTNKVLPLGFISQENPPWPEK